MLRPPAEGSDPTVALRSQEVPANKQFGRYRLDGEIARGGMGAIIRSQDTDLGRDVAIKVLLNSHKQVAEVAERFIEEAQIGGQLQHPGIAPIYELGQLDDGRPYFSMKLVKGNTLASMLADRKDMAEDRARLIGIFRQVCQTMSYAHSRGVIHRDLKPANIMIGAFGEVQVMDWGLAKVLGSGGIVDERKSLETHENRSEVATSGSNDLAESHTASGSVLGTPSYMAPEQARGEIDRLDERADTFGLGAILCEILTGSPPYLGETGDDVFRAAVNGDLAPCFVRLDEARIDPELRQLTRDCLADSVNDRARDAGVISQRISAYVASVETRMRQAEVQSASEKSRADEAIKTVAAERQRRRYSLALAASILLSVSVGGYALTWFSQREQNRLQANAEVVSKTLENVYRLRSDAEGAVAENKIARWTAVVAEAQKASALVAQGNEHQDIAKRAARVLMEAEETAIRVGNDLRNAASQKALAARLDVIRLRRSEGRGTTSFDLVSTDERYNDVFQDAGVDISKLTSSEASLRI